MNHSLIAFLSGLICGGLAVGWFSWAFVHQRLSDVETALHDRFSAFERNVASHFHRSTPAIDAAKPADVSASQ